VRKEDIMQQLIVSLLVMALAVGSGSCGGDYLGTAPGDGGADSSGVVYDGPTGMAIYYRRAIQDDFEAQGCTAATSCHAVVAMDKMPVTFMPTNEADWMANYTSANWHKAHLGAFNTAVPPGPHGLVPAAVASRWQAWAAGGAPYQAPPDAAPGAPDAAGGAPDAMMVPDAVTGATDAAP
jgi:hypothetical protein